MYRNSSWNDLVGLSSKVKVFDPLLPYIIVPREITLIDLHYTFISEPDFVSAYEVDNFIYFFFREVATEYINCGKVNFCQNLNKYWISHY